MRGLIIFFALGVLPFFTAAQERPKQEVQSNPLQRSASTEASTCGSTDPKLIFPDGSQSCWASFSLFRRGDAADTWKSGWPTWQSTPGVEVSNFLSLLRGSANNHRQHLNAIAAPRNAERCPFVVGVDFNSTFSVHTPGKVLARTAVDLCNTNVRGKLKNAGESDDCTCEPLIIDSRPQYDKAEFIGKLLAFENNLDAWNLPLELQDDPREKLRLAGAQSDQKGRMERADQESREAELQRRLEDEERVRREAEQKALIEKNKREGLAAENERLRAELAQTRVANAASVAYRKALVIGIDSYRHITRLSTAREDARAMGHAFSAAGFTVTLHLDLSEKDMRAALRSFAASVEGGDEVAFFFAGHGVQIAGVNYLIPADLIGESEGQLREDAIPLQRILDDMTDRKAKVTLAVIDACRDNPFRIAGRNVGNVRGLAPTTPATGQLIIFSAGAGQRALDTLGPDDRTPNGVFTRVFVQEMKQRGVPVEAVARRARLEVVRLARTIGHEQVPAIYDQLLGEFYLIK